MTTLRVGSRRSRLALAQTDWVAAQLRAAWPELRVVVVPITTAGDRSRASNPAAVGGKGVFVKEIEEALLAGDADVAVHSAKDLPAELPEGLDLICVPERADARDCLVGRSLAELPAGARVGTGSPRRQAQLLALRPDLHVVPLRGNVGTRLRLATAGERCRAAVLALAGLQRLGLAGEVRQTFAPVEMLPAPGQGALAIEGRAADAEVRRRMAPLADPAAAAEVVCERAFLRAMGGGCSAPIAALARCLQGRLSAEGLLATGGTLRRARVAGSPGEAAALGERLAAEVGR